MKQEVLIQYGTELNYRIGSIRCSIYNPSYRTLDVKLLTIELPERTKLEPENVKNIQGFISRFASSASVNIVKFKNLDRNTFPSVFLSSNNQLSA